MRIANDTLQALWAGDCDDDASRDKKARAALSGLVGIAPRDELEAMLAAQLIAAHSASMESFRRATVSEHTVRQEELNQANKLSRTFATLLDALNNHRGKGQQKIKVEHVHVHAGGQAVVGIVERAGGGDRRKPEEQPHEPMAAHAPEPALPSADTEQNTVPLSGNAQRPLPAARRTVARRAKG
jgi:hypothetical protein